MKVLAFNSSPKGDKGNTSLILNPFLEGMTEAGAEVDLFYTKKLNIQPCTGEFDCWFKHPGQCHHNDDMNDIYPKLFQADLWVLGTPVYACGMPGPMKNLIDRAVLLDQPFLEIRDDHCRHPLYEGVKKGKAVLVANCGLWEIDNFDPLLAHVKAICADSNREFAGALLRPHGEAMTTLMEMGIDLRDVFQAAKDAGRQLVTTGDMSTETLSIISRDLVSRDTYVEAANWGFRQVMDALERRGPVQGSLAERLRLTGTILQLAQLVMSDQQKKDAKDQ